MRNKLISKFLKKRPSSFNVVLYKKIIKDSFQFDKNKHVMLHGYTITLIVYKMSYQTFINRIKSNIESNKAKTTLNQYV